MSISTFTNKTPAYSTAQHELVEHATRGQAVRRLRHYNPEELLFYTLPYALASEDTSPMAAWVKYFMETEP